MLLNFFVEVIKARALLKQMAPDQYDAYVVWIVVQRSQFYNHRVHLLIQQELFRR